MTKTPDNDMKVDTSITEQTSIHGCLKELLIFFYGP